MDYLTTTIVTNDPFGAVHSITPKIIEFINYLKNWFDIKRILMADDLETKA